MMCLLTLLEYVKVNCNGNDIGYINTNLFDIVSMLILACSSAYLQYLTLCTFLQSIKHAMILRCSELGRYVVSFFIDLF